MSQDRDGDEAGVTRQRAACQKLCAARGWVVADVFTDNDLSAAGKVRRPGFDQLVAAIQSGRIRAVVAYAMDRITRNARDAVTFLDAAQAAQVRVLLVNGGELDLATPMGQFAAEMSAGIAKLEIQTKSERQRLANRQRASQGKRTSAGRRAFGYDHRMNVVPDEARAVQDAYAAVLAGASLSSIAKDWRSRGFTTPQARRGDHRGQPGGWTGQVLSRTLRNPTYAALARYDGDLIPAVWPALVTEDVWRAAQAVLTDPSRRTSGGTRALLTGLAQCGVDGCGLTVHGGAGYASRRSYRTYRCRSMGHIHRKAEPIDDYVAAVAVARLSRPDARALMDDTKRPDVSGLRADADGLRRRIEALADDLDIDERTLARRDKALRTRLAGIEAQLADAGRVDLLGPLVGADDVEAAWNGLDIDRRRAVVDLLMTVRLLPPGRGVRDFDPATVDVQPK